MMPDRSAVGRPGERPAPGGGGRGAGGPGGPGGAGLAVRAVPVAAAGSPVVPVAAASAVAARVVVDRGCLRARRRSPVRGRKSKRAKRQEFEQMQAPSLGGVSVPRGDGNTSSGASRRRR